MSAMLHRFADRAVRQYKQAKWKGRCLPDLLIAGCQKGGTSSLHTYLAQHPKMFPGDIKEIHFFDGGLQDEWDKYAAGEPLYRSYFPQASKVRAAGGLTFEASPTYMFSPYAPERMAAMVPDAKIVLLLRDPVERAISHYFHESRRGRESLDIEAAFQAEQERLAPAIASGNFKSQAWIRHSYVERGLYAKQIKRLLEYYNQSQIKIYDSADLFAAPATIVEDVLTFVGLSADGLNVDYKPVGTGTNRKAVPDGVRDFLNAAFEVPNRELETLLNRSFSWSR